MWQWNIKKSQQNDSENISNKNDKEITKEKYLSNFWRTLEMHLINCEVTLDIIGLKTAL